MKTVEAKKFTEAEKIGAVCRGLRAMHGMTQDELADRMGVTAPTLRAIEDGKPQAVNYVLNMAAAMGVKLGDVDGLMDLLVNSTKQLDVVS